MLEFSLSWDFPRTLRSCASDLDPPSDGETVTRPPTEIRLTFSERPSIAIASVLLVSGTDSIPLAPLQVDTADRNTVIAPINRSLGGGAYQVVWRVASRDGHPIRGAYSFTIAPQPGDSIRNAPAVPAIPVSTEIDEADTSIAVGAAFGSILIRWLAFISIFLAIGAVTFRQYVLGRTDPAGSETFREIASTNAATLGLVARLGR